MRHKSYERTIAQALASLQRKAQQFTESVRDTNLCYFEDRTEELAEAARKYIREIDNAKRAERRRKSK